MQPRGHAATGADDRADPGPSLPLLKGDFAAKSSNPTSWLIQFPSLVPPEQRDSLQREILGATRERMVREICELLEAVTAEGPLLLILEDPSESLSDRALPAASTSHWRGLANEHPCW